MKFNIIENDDTKTRSSLSFFNGIPLFIENEIDDFIVKKIRLRDQTKNELSSISSHELINLLVSDLCDHKSHLHTIKCILGTEAFDSLSDNCKWNIDLSDLNKFFSMRISDNSSYNLLNNNRICLIQGNILGYLLDKANKSSHNYLADYPIQVDGIYHEINLLSPFVYLDDSDGVLYADKINEFSNLENSFKSISNLHIEKILARVWELPSSVTKCFINNSEFLITNKFISNSIIKDSRIDYTLNSFYGNNNLSNSVDLYASLGFFNNEVYSSNLAFFTPWTLNIPNSIFYIDNCNFYNSVIEIYLHYNMIASYHSTIKFIFRNCYFNNTIIDNFIDESDVSIHFENCVFGHSNTKFEIEKMI